MFANDTRSGGGKHAPGRGKSTVLYISKTDLQNKAKTSGIRSNGNIAIQDRKKSANYQTWTINGDPNYGEAGVRERDGNFGAQHGLQVLVGVE